MVLSPKARRYSRDLPTSLLHRRVGEPRKGESNLAFVSSAYSNAKRLLTSCLPEVDHWVSLGWEPGPAPPPFQLKIERLLPELILAQGPKCILLVSGSVGICWIWDFMFLTLSSDCMCKKESLITLLWHFHFRLADTPSGGHDSGW